MAKAMQPAIALIILLGASATAMAQSCGGEIDRLARQYDLAVEAPRAGTPENPAAPAAPGGASAGTTTTERLARSGGVLTPPDVNGSMAIEPPRPNPDRMPTAPAVTPRPHAGAEADGLTAAQRAQMQSLLQAARQAERQGREEQCLERLRAAEAVPHPPAAK